ncbi:MAG TPA: hypothetical protein VIJ43_12895 [Burkholderiales bacterium]
MARAAIARSRALTMLLVRIEIIRTKSMVPDKGNNGLGLFLSKIADCARMAFHPCAIDDPRGRFLVRAKSKLCNGARFKSPGMAFLT